MSDLIDRQSAIDAFEKELSAKYNRIEMAIGFVGVKSILQGLPSAQTEQRWIPCSERLPEKGKVVLITNDKGNVRCGQYRGLWSANGNVTQWTFRGNVIETVLAWMPIPEPYEAESEDKE